MKLNESLRVLQDIAFNIGYADGLVRVCQNRGLPASARRAGMQFDLACKLWEIEKNRYIASFGDIQCPVVRQLVNVLLEDRCKHLNTGLKSCSDNYSSRKTDRVS